MDNGQNYNVAVAKIMGAIGYVTAAGNVLERPDDLYAAWAKDQSSLFFRRVHVGGWTDRRFLDCLFKEGPEAILCLAQKSTEEVRLARDKHSLGKSDAAQVFRVHVPKGL